MEVGEWREVKVDFLSLSRILLLLVEQFGSSGTRESGNESESVMRH